MATPKLRSSLVWVGVACSIGLIVLSAAVNARVGFRRADTELDGYIYGAGMALADVLKALCPFFAATAFAHGQWLRAGAAWLVFGIITVVSLQSGLEFAAELRQVRDSNRISAQETRRGLSDTQKRLEADLDRVGPQRSTQEVAADIEAVLARPIAGGTVGSVSEQCTLSRRSTREACEEIRKLGSEAAKAEERQSVVTQLEQTKSRIAQLGAEGVGRADPQLDTIGGLLRWVGVTLDNEKVRLALLLLVGLVFEAGSGLGLYVSLASWREGEERVPPDENDRQLGSVDDYAGARFRPAADHRLSYREAFGDYVIWCQDQGHIPVAYLVFEQALTTLASAVGIPVERQDAIPALAKVALMDGSP